MLLPGIALSQESQAFVRLLCAPELDYFELSSATVFNPNAGGGDFSSGGNLGGKYGFYSLGKPFDFRCDLKSRAITVRAVGRVLQATGKCGAESRGSVRILLNDREVVNSRISSWCFESLLSAVSHPLRDGDSSMWSICRRTPSKEDLRFPDSKYDLICTWKFFDLR